MPYNSVYLPEGLHPARLPDLSALRAALEDKTILETTVLRCDARRTLHLALAGGEVLLPPEEAVAHWISGAGRDIALLSLVGKPIAFRVTALDADGRGAPQVRVSRRILQEEAKEHLLSLRPGSVLWARVTHLAAFGAFCDIGCGVIALLPLERLSMARVRHPAERLAVGQKLPVLLSGIDPAVPRFTLSCRELLGTWLENASRFAPGDTVPGVVRSVQDYGIFVELTPNLSGLAPPRDGIAPGDRISVTLRSIRPERMKIKLQIVGKLPPRDGPEPLRFILTDGVLPRWRYSPPDYERPPVETVFFDAPEPPPEEPPALRGWQAESEEDSAGKFMEFQPQ